MKQKRIGHSAHKRPRAADDAFDEEIDQAGYGDSREKKADAHSDCREHGLERPRQIGRGGRKDQKKNSERPEEPARFSKIRDLIEGPDDPVRQLLHGADRGRVQHDHDEDNRGGSANGRNDDRVARPPRRERRGSARRPRQDSESVLDIRDHAAQSRKPTGVVRTIGVTGCRHGAAAERKIEIITGRPVLIL
ncbi:MAG: hypothetical protein WBD48_08865 [Pseudolabrys sp.]